MVLFYCHFGTKCFAKCAKQSPEVIRYTDKGKLLQIRTDDLELCNQPC